MLSKPLEESLPLETWILGTGTFAQFLHQELINRNCKVLGYLDDYRDGSINGKPISPVASVPTGATVILGILNPYVKVQDKITQLKKLGVSDFWTPPRIAAALGRNNIHYESFWLTTEKQFLGDVDNHLEFVLNNLSDQYSRELFLANLNYRISGDCDYLMPPEPLHDQYFPHDLDFTQNCDVYVDIGAFDGDTVRSLNAHNVRPNLYLGFEPDPENFSKLKQEIDGADFRYAIFPLGTSGNTSQFSFSAGGSSSAGITEFGDSVIQCVALDDLLGFPVSHIKMDIEGAELDTLKGLRRTIQTCKPNLAVSVYHKPDDVWVLMNEIMTSGIDYRFYMRCYAEQTFETVLYAIHE